MSIRSEEKITRLKVESIMTLDMEMEQKVSRLLNEQKLGVLATFEPQQPYLSLIAFCHTPDLRRIIFATDRSTRKYKNLINNSRTAILFDNRIVSESNFRAGLVVTAYGSTEELIGLDISMFRESYLEKHPNMRDFLYSSSTALLSLTVDYFQIVENFQNVTVLTMN